MNSYDIYPDVLALSTSTGEERRHHCRRIAAVVDDKAILRTLFGIDPEEFADFYPDMRPPVLSTNDAIDTFLDRFGDKNVAATAEEVVPVAPPAIDYAATLEDEITDGPLPDDDTSSTIDAFLKKMPVKKTARPQHQTKTEDTPDAEKNTDLSEGLARIMIKNRNYQKALEIITELSLNNPKKSIYFADQIRFLKKLIANSQNQTGK